MVIIILANENLRRFGALGYVKQTKTNKTWVKSWKGFGELGTLHAWGTAQGPDCLFEDV